MRWESRFGEFLSNMWTAPQISTSYFLVAAISASGQIKHGVIEGYSNVPVTTHESVTISVRSNNSDDPVYPPSVTHVMPATSGTAVIDPSGTTITFTPHREFSEEDSFIYEIGNDEEFIAFEGAIITSGEPTPPLDRKSTYDGIRRINGPTSSIRITLAISDPSRFTGSARFDGKTFRIRGKLVEAVAAVKLPQGNSLDTTLNSAAPTGASLLDWTNSSLQKQAWIDDGNPINNLPQPPGAAL